ncbi:hypothetical protein SAY86_012330 [Trapa natans]|uniref:Glycosyltransferase n=1 Tax=Trapa natans TaxID=22666 RepID=A0AAN7LWJ9_TRANT|nr:hypothetical protein SAY86_012330 [Trapa natans]
MGRRAELVFIPTPGVGHLVSTVELVKHLIDRDEGLSAAILVMTLTDNSAVKTTIDSISSSSFAVRIRFIELPEPEQMSASGTTSPFKNYLNSIERYIPSVRGFIMGEGNLGSKSQPRLAAFVVDMFCASMIDVANEFGIPSYVFFTSSASFLGAMFHLQALQEDGQDISLLVNSNAAIDYRGFEKKFPAKLLPYEMKDEDVGKVFLSLAKRFKETKGVMVNTFEDIDSRAVEYMSYNKLSKLYAVGPILNLKTADNTVVDDILKWLDGQPLASVVFLCFGSKGSCREDQVRQIAYALEKSGHGFLWCLRRPSPVGTFQTPRDYDDPSEVLPEGFLDRTAGRGKVIGWAPQSQVLAHRAVGGFVTHCGWNSTLESVWFGVPMAVWPMYAEQHFNAFALVEEIGMAVEMSMEYRKEIESAVPAEVIERGIRLLMGGEREEMKAKVKQMREWSRKALMEGGSSHLNLGQFIEDVYSSICP